MRRSTSRLCSVLPVVLLPLLALGCGGDEPAAPEPEAEPAGITLLADGWNVIEPGGDTTCSDGSPFRFFVRPGDPQKVHFYLEGGGACWNGATCDVEGEPSYSPVVNDTDGEAATGVFDFTREDNPLADYSTIFVPYCTGDVHLGDRDVEYTATTGDGTERTFTIHHRGLVNGRAALDWLYANVDDPSRVFVSGSSAGSIPSPVYAHWIAGHWPSAAVVQLGDGAGGYRGTAEPAPYDSWGTLEALAWDELDADERFSFEDLYVGAAQRSGEVRYAAYDTAEDSVQLDFLRLADQGTESLLPLLDANHDEIGAADPDFTYFVAGGDVHTILRRPEVYTYRVGDRTFLGWLTDLVEGRGPEAVRCDDCSVAETLTPPEATEGETVESSEG